MLTDSRIDIIRHHAPISPADSIGARCAREDAGPGLRAFVGESDGAVFLARIERHAPDEYGDTWSAYGVGEPWSDHWR